MTTVTLADMRNGSLQYKLSDTVLWDIGFITLKPTDWSVKHSPLAATLFETPDILEVGITENPAGQFVSIKREKAFTPGDAEKFKGVINTSLARNAPVDEEALIKEANVQSVVPSLDLDFSNAVAHYIVNKFTPLIAKEMKHDAGLEFVRFYKTAGPDYMAGIALRKACGSCSVSSLGTLRQLYTKLNQFAESTRAIPDGGRISGFYILPDSKGSPSFTFSPKQD
jgi:Fe-S cluster biogenesis protein NfuA